MLPRAGDDEKKKKPKEPKKHFLGLIPRGGVYISIAFLVVTIAIAVVGYLFPNQWYLFIQVTVLFVVGDLYFEMLLKYKKDKIVIPFIGKEVTNEYGILFAYFLGVLVSALAVFLFSQALDLVKAGFQNWLTIPIVSIILTLIVCLQIKVRIK